MFSGKLYNYVIQVTRYSDVSIVTASLSFAVSSPKCHKFLTEQMKTQFNY